MKNVKRSMFVICLMALSQLVAQVPSEVHFKVSPDPTALLETPYEYLLGHRVFLRQTPSKQGKKRTLLNIGTPLILTEKSEKMQKINGVYSHWYHVIAGDQSGWVWGGLIAQKTLGSQANYDVKFVYGLEKIQINDSLIEEKHQIRAFKNGRQLDKIVFDGHESNPLEIQNIGNKGLFNVEDILTVQVADTQEGSNQGKMYIFWNNGKFTYVANLINETGSNYNKDESFVFPSDMEGVKSTILLKTKITEKSPNAEGVDAGPGDTRLTITSYAWNGYKLLQKEGTPSISSAVVARTNPLGK